MPLLPRRPLLWSVVASTLLACTSPDEASSIGVVEGSYTCHIVVTLTSTTAATGTTTTTSTTDGSFSFDQGSSSDEVVMPSTIGGCSLVFKVNGSTASLIPQTCKGDSQTTTYSSGTITVTRSHLSSQVTGTIASSDATGTETIASECDRIVY